MKRCKPLSLNGLSSQQLQGLPLKSGPFGPFARSRRLPDCCRHGAIRHDGPARESGAKGSNPRIHRKQRSAAAKLADESTVAQIAIR
jgi:hypothetical protein